MKKILFAILRLMQKIVISKIEKNFLIFMWIIRKHYDHERAFCSFESRDGVYVDDDDNVNYVDMKRTQNEKNEGKRLDDRRNLIYKTAMMMMMKARCNSQVNEE